MAVAIELLTMGYGVSFPFGHSHQYDLVVDRDGSLHTIQVKTGTHEQGGRYYIPVDADRYDDQHVDLLAGYSWAKESAFYIPTAEASGKRQRVTFIDFEQMDSEKNQAAANHISDYRFEEAIQRV